MNQEDNPYASPAALDATASPPPVAGNPAASIGVDGKKIVIGKGGTLPPYCVKTNAEATHHIKRTYYWHHPAIFLAIIPGLLFYVILAVVLRKKMVLHVPLGAEAFARRRRVRIIAGCALLICVITLGGGLTILLSASPQDERQAGVGGLMAMLAFVGLVIAAVVHSSASAILKPTKIDDHRGWFRGASSQFLDRIRG